MTDRDPEPADAPADARAASRPAASVTLAYPRGDVAWTYVVLVGGGVALGAVLHLLRGRLLSLDVLPWRGVVVTVDRVVDGWGAWGPVALVAAGALLGALLAAAEVDKEPRFEIAPDRVVVVRGKSRRTYLRADVREALHEDGAVVLLASNGTELVRVQTGIAAADLERAFRDAGYTWDPHA